MIEFTGARNPARDGGREPGTERGYVARPAGDAGRGVLVLHAWWGLTAMIRDVCDRLAGEGYLALAPDLFDGRTASTIEDAERQSAEAEGDDERMEQAVLGSIDWLRSETKQPIATIGFSFGAPYALWASKKRPDDVDSVVVFYGTGVTEFDKGNAPVQGHFAEADPYEPAEAVRELETAVRDAGREADIHVYPGTTHWFFESDRPEYNADAAALAWQRTLAFLADRR